MPQQLIRIRNSTSQLLIQDPETAFKVRLDRFGSTATVWVQQWILQNSKDRNSSAVEDHLTIKEEEVPNHGSHIYS